MFLENEFLIVIKNIDLIQSHNATCKLSISLKKNSSDIKFVPGDVFTDVEFLNTNCYIIYPSKNDVIANVNPAYFNLFPFVVDFENVRIVCKNEFTKILYTKEA